MSEKKKTVLGFMAFVISIIVFAIMIQTNSIFGTIVSVIGMVVALAYLIYRFINLYLTDLFGKDGF